MKPNLFFNTTETKMSNKMTTKGILKSKRKDLVKTPQI